MTVRVTQIIPTHITLHSHVPLDLFAVVPASVDTAVVQPSNGSLRMNKMTGILFLFYCLIGL